MLLNRLCPVNNGIIERTLIKVIQEETRIRAVEDCNLRWQQNGDLLIKIFMWINYEGTRITKLGVYKGSDEDKRRNKDQDRR